MPNADCTCKYDEYEIVTEFCRPCAINLEQGSEAWSSVRLGRLTSSRASDAFARIKSGWGASRSNYRAELICERLSGQPYDRYNNWYMERGNEVEPKAVTAYEFIVGLETQKTGFWMHPTIPMAGSSPDRLVGDVGMLEAKARTTAIHFDLLLTHKIPDKFIQQIQFGFACNPIREWCDFVSYDPRAPGDFDLFVKRIWRDDRRIKELENQGIEFLAEVDEHMQALQEKATTGFIFTGVERNGDGLLSALTGSLAMLEEPTKVVAIKTKRKRTAVE